MPVLQARAPLIFGVACLNGTTDTNEDGVRSEDSVVETQHLIAGYLSEFESNRVKGRLPVVLFFAAQGLNRFVNFDLGEAGVVEE